jgi:hypothetical protein
LVLKKLANYCLKEEGILADKSRPGRGEKKGDFLALKIMGFRVKGLKNQKK